MAIVGVNFQVFAVDGAKASVDAVRAISLGEDIDICQVHYRPIFVGVDCIGTSTVRGDVAVGDVGSQSRRFRRQRQH